MTAKPDTTLHAAFSSLKERGFTPKIQYLEVFRALPRLRSKHPPAPLPHPVLRA